MVFSSLLFLFRFLPAVLITYYLVPKKFRNLVLLLFSLVFYEWGEPIYIVLMVFSILFNYLSGLEIDDCKERGDVLKGKIAFWMAVGVNLGILGFFKYAGFVVENLNRILPFDISMPALALPIGISFYTFQTLSYIIDVYKGNVKVQKNVINFGTYISMFPQLIAGPIVRYADVEGQLVERKVTLTKFGEGTAWFLRGLAKKVLLANNIGMLFDAVQAMGAGNISMLTAWLGCAAYTFQIYFDFSGYSDMAIGLGKMFGFTFMKNFDYPYTSSSITEFWRRWHISLGTWFREYVYIPLGGNRRSSGRVYFNLFAVWLLTGFWHGAGWNFILWGVVLFVIIALEKAGLKKVLDRFRIMGHLYMVILIPLTWMIFAITDIEQLGIYAQRLVDFAGKESDTVFSGDAGKYWDMYGWLLMVCAVLSVSGPARLFERIRRTMAGSIILFAIFWGSVYCLYIGLNDPFLYFRF